MENFTIKRVNQTNGVNIYFIAPHPIYRDFFSAVDYFNKINNEIENGIAFMDLLTLVGNQKNRFVSAEISNYSLNPNSIKIIEFCEKLENFTKNSYTQLSEAKINMVYPIAFRNEILERKRKMKF